MLFLMAVLFIYSTASAQERAVTTFPNCLATTQSVQNVIPNDDDPARTPGQLLLFENFESTYGSSIPDGWYRSQTSGYYWRSGNNMSNWGGMSGVPGVFGSARYVGISYVTSGTTNSWLITPALNFETGKTYSISFYTITYGYRPSEYDKLRVSIGAEQTVAAMTTPLIEFTNQFMDNWVKVSLQFKHTGATGAMYLGFCGFTPIGQGYFITIDDVKVAEMAEHDMEIYDNFPYAQIPTMLPVPLSAQATNIGMNPQTNVKLSALLNGTTLNSPTGITVASNETVVLSIPPSVTPVPTTNTVKFTVTQAENDQFLANNSSSVYTFQGSSGVYATDHVTSTDEYGLGFNSAVTFGNIYEITTAQTLSQVVIGFDPAVYSAPYCNFTLSLYKMSGNLTVEPTDLLSAVPAVKTPGWSIITVPPVALEAGARYFLAINQLTTWNIGISFQPAFNKLFYTLNKTNYTLGTDNVGNEIALRMVLANPACAAAPPTGLTATPGGIGEVALSWTGTTPHYFLVTLHDGTTEKKYNVYGNTISLTGISSGNYTWSVRAMCDAVNGSTATAGTPFYVVGCGDIVLPWEYSFEDGPVGYTDIPCFTQDPATGYYRWTVYQESYNNYNQTPRTGTKNAYLSSGNTAWLFREANLQPGNYTFGVWTRQDKLVGASITLKYGTVATVAGMVNTIVPQTNIVNGDYQNIRGFFTVTTAGKYVFGIQGITNYTPSALSIDDIYLKRVYCTGITGINVTDIDLTTATLSWSSNGVPTVGYDIYITTSSKEPTATTTPTFSVSSATTTYPLTSLTNNTTYYVWMRTNCGAGTETDWWLKKFTTACGSVTPPWYYGFEDGTHNSTTIPCFTQQSVSGTNTWTVNETDQYNNKTPRTGLRNAFISYSQSRWLFREAYLEPGIHSFGLWARQSGANVGSAKLTISYGTNATAAAMVNNIVPQSEITNGAYQECKGYFTITTPGTYYLGIWAVLNANTNCLSIDDLALEKLADLDMAVISITGNLYPKALSQEFYTVTVKNVGELTANNAKISIVTENGIELASETVTLSSLEDYVTTLIVTFAQNMAGAMNIKAVVTLNGDKIPENNEVALAVNVFPHMGYEINCNDEITLTTGNVANSTNIPTNNTYRRSYTEQIYDAADIDLAPGTVINGIAFLPTYYYPYDNTYTKKNQAIYLANTSKDIFNNATDHIPADQFQYVFSGSVTFTHRNYNTAYWQYIPFEIPFVYEGQNIVVALANNEENYVSGGYSSEFRVGSTTGAKAITSYMDDISMWLTPSNLPTSASPFYFSTAIYTQRNHVAFVTCDKLYTLHPDNITDPRIELNPSPVAAGQTATVTFTDTEPDDCYYISDVHYGGVSIGQPLPNPYSFTVTGALDIFEIFYDLLQYEIIASVNPATPYGAIDPAGVVAATCSQPKTFFMYPDPGYKVGAITVDGEVVNPANKYSFPATTDHTIAHTIEVTFVECPFSIHFIKEGEGSIYQHFANGTIYEIMGENMGVDYGMNHFTFAPAANYTLQAVYIDGVYNTIASLTGSYLFQNVTSDHTIKVVFKADEYVIVAIAGAHGAISPSGNVAVSYGEDKKFTFTPQTNYEIDYVSVDNVINANAAANGFHIFENIAGPHTIYVTFKKANMYVTVTEEGTCGAVSPNGVVPIPYNGTQVFTFMQNEGCKVSMVYVDGVPYPNAISTGSYTFYYIDEQTHTLRVAFEKKSYPITAQISDHGVMTNLGTTYIEHGDNKTYTFSAQPGYEVKYVYVDGLNKPAAILDGFYTFYDVTAPHTLNVIVKPVDYYIKAEATAGGYITPLGNIPVTYQGSLAFTFAALPGYEIEKVLIDDVVNIEAAENGAFAFVNIDASHTIKVCFKISRYQIKATNGIGGAILPTGITEITHFDNITYTITPDEEYKISYIMVNGTNMGALETFTFSNVLTDGDIEAHFLYSPMGNDDEEDEDDELSINDPVLDGISIYNRTNVIYIVNENHLPLSDVTIFDMYGRVVWQGIPQGNTITHNLPTGIYTIRITSKNNFTITKVPILK